MEFSLSLTTKGYVTTYKAVAGRSHADLEKALGLAVGALNSGYRVYQLSDPVGPNDFEWKDHTRYSDGWHADSSIGYYVRRADELRADLGKKHDYNDAAVDEKLMAFQTVQMKKLNVRSGPDRIVKIVPNSEGTTYPDSPYGEIPQWKLIVGKTFSFIGTSV